MDGSEQMIIMSQALPSHTETDDHIDDQAVQAADLTRCPISLSCMNSNFVFLFELRKTPIFYTMKLPCHRRFEISKYDYAVSEI